jgi:hypothetical protein
MNIVIRTINVDVNSAKDRSLLFQELTVVINGEDGRRQLP